jgi:hypothetical protein
MEEDRITKALARIEAAAGRIAAAASEAYGDGEERAQNQARHDRLRKEASDILQDLDRLIGSLEP